MAREAPPTPILELPLLEDPRALPGVRLLRESASVLGAWSHFDGVTADNRRPVRTTIVATALAHRPGYAERFEADVARLRGLASPALPGLVDGGRAERGLFLVTEPPPRRTLLDVVDGRAREPEAVLALLAPVAAALDALHAAGVVHAAVSPEVIRVDAEGGARLLDAGLADAGTAEADLGPDWPPCVAPELHAGKAATPAADVYGLAATLWRCLSGGYEREPDRATVPEGVLAALKRGLVRDPRLRTSSATELVDTVLLGVFGRGPG